jgi:hypothetical protein
VFGKQQILPLCGRGTPGHEMFATVRTLEPVSQAFPVRSKNRLKKDSSPGPIPARAWIHSNFGLRKCFSYNS